MNPEILKYSLKKGLLLDKEIYEVLSTINEEEAKNILEIISGFKTKIINKGFFEENAAKINAVSGNTEFLKKLKINLVNIEISYEEKPVKKEVEEIKQIRNIKVINSIANLGRKIQVEDFVKHFRSRFSELRRVLQEHSELDNLTSINKIGSQRQNLSIVGVVYAKRVTKNKNILLELEDLTGKISVIINQNKPDVYEKAQNIILDGVIGVRGSSSNNWFFANDIIYPDMVLNEKTSMGADESIAFISDVHVGSKMFLEKNFLKFIQWVNGEIGDENQREEARKVKYITITGDTIDGIGVYPGQELLLDIKDIKKQYEKLAEMLGMIRKDVSIILCPGQHDAVRVAEPQPALTEEYAYALHELDNLILVSNPAMVEINNNGGRGLKILMYHGASMHPLISEIESLRIARAHDTPSKVVKYLLKMRHLSPLHSAVTYIPTEDKDELIIREIPDIITTADLHRPDIDIYNNILIVCSSCWQSMTPFEEKVGNHPDPCKVPIFNIRSRQIKILDFSDSPQEKVCEEKSGAVVCEVKK